ncbi:tail fiber domain-containing protein [Pseudovibrio sp. Tun.PSC04-5.I4]|uniref:tail fiber domain-containing protein n=1 Tax=Pseudovibrio sp. Tun.PSC04-5.I4 TaxID=1798213 RepID=UPI000880C5FB|nr:tail fiber domain-containing protein [Pseudovibrio sp. Tun.PSC04-5.I4]SDQ99872.1 Phage tail repeat like [Pseudovibrio sp. Tun.PSC04-5.I4]
MTVDNKTEHFDLPLPHPENPPRSVDVQRLRDALTAIDVVIYQRLGQALSTEDVNALISSALGPAVAAAKAEVLSDMTGGVLQAELDTLKEIGEALTVHEGDSEAAFAAINQAIAQRVTLTAFQSLVTSVAGKADAAHTHQPADITGLQNLLNGKADLFHTHSMGNVSGLQAALDGKAISGHVHSLLKFAGNTKLQADVNGAKVTGRLEASGDVTAFSDARLKQNIAPLTEALAKVLQLQGCSYEKDGKQSLGLIAQQVQEVVPEVVHSGTFLSLAYGNLVALLIEAIKELNTRLSEVEGK